MTQITSTSNPLIKRYEKLKHKKYRLEEKLYIVEGFHLVEEAKKAGVIVEILTSDEKIEGTKVSQRIIEKLSSTKTPQAIIAVCKITEKEVSGNKILALDNIQDPGNLGTLIRTAKAFGWDGIIFSGVDPYNPKVIRSSQGAFFTMPMKRVSDITEYFGDYHIIGAILDKTSMDYKEAKIKERIMLVLGNESNGISKETQTKINQKVYIPIEFESLNVAQAGAILMNEYK